MNLQPTHLEDSRIRLEPLRESDFERLYAVASDPLVWEQHPNKDRYKRVVFKTFFEGAMESKGAFIAIDKATGEVIGSSRFYGYDAEKRELTIGYTFIGRKFWGGGYNPAMKKLMLNYAFQFVDRVYFHIGAQNIRSQKAIERLGAKKIGEKEMSYYGEYSTLNFIYVIERK